MRRTPLLASIEPSSASSSDSPTREAEGGLSRRDFCAIGIGCTGLALFLASCTDGNGGVVSTGPLGDEPDAAPVQPGDPDARIVAPADAHVSAPDAGTSGPVCTGSQVDCGGAPSTFAIGTPKKISGINIYIVRDAQGLFAVSSKCTHQGAQNVVQSGEFYCPRHGATFKYDGTILGGPVSQPLAHYSMCILSNGHAGVDTAVTTAKTTRLTV
jgi:nitrite reductase/ring-hydroxylating ferredoxin subunit